MKAMVVTTAVHMASAAKEAEPTLVAPPTRKVKNRKAVKNPCGSCGETRNGYFGLGGREFTCYWGKHIGSRLICEKCQFKCGDIFKEWNTKDDKAKSQNSIRENGNRKEKYLTCSEMYSRCELATKAKQEEMDNYDTVNMPYKSKRDWVSEEINELQKWTRGAFNKEEKYKKIAKEFVAVRKTTESKWRCKPRVCKNCEPQVRMLTRFSDTHTCWWDEEGKLKMIPLPQLKMGAHEQTLSPEKDCYYKQETKGMAADVNAGGRKVYVADRRRRLTSAEKVLRRLLL